MKVKIYKEQLNIHTGKFQTKLIELDDVILIRIDKQEECETFLTTSFLYKRGHAH